MKMILAGAVALLATGVAVQAQELQGFDQVAGWDVLVDPTLDNGCLINAEFEDGSDVRIGFDMRELPVLDGKGHRARLVSDGKGEKSGYYKGSMVGLPGGYAKNHRTDEEVRWVQKGITLPPAQLAAARAQAEQLRQQREAETMEGYKRVAAESAFMLATLPKVSTGPALSPEQIEYMKLMGKDPAAQGDSAGSNFPTLAQMGRVMWEHVTDPFYDNGPNDKGIGIQLAHSLGRVGLGYLIAMLIAIRGTADI